MTIKSIQKVIKIGDSVGVTFPAKDMKYAHIKVGDDVEIVVNRKQSHLEQKSEVVEVTQRLIKRHIKALKNLSER